MTRRQRFALIIFITSLYAFGLSISGYLTTFHPLVFLVMATFGAIEFIRDDERGAAK